MNVIISIILCPHNLVCFYFGIIGKSFDSFLKDKKRSSFQPLPRNYDPSSFLVSADAKYTAPLTESQYQSQFNMSTTRSSTKKPKGSKFPFYSPPMKSPTSKIKRTPPRESPDNDSLFLARRDDSYSRGSPATSIGTSVAPGVDFETNVYVENTFVDIKIQLKKGDMTDFPFSVLTLHTSKGHATADKAHIMDTFHIFLPIKQSVGWEKVWSPNHQAHLSQARDGIFVEVPDYHHCMAKSMDTFSTRLEQVHGESNERETTLEVQTLELEDKGINHKLFFLRFPIDELTGNPYKCTNEEFQKPFGPGSNEATISTHPAIKTLIHRDPKLKNQNNSLFYYFFSLGIEDTKKLRSRINKREYDSFNTEKMLDELNRANGLKTASVHGNNSSDQSAMSEDSLFDSDDDDRHGEYIQIERGICKIKL